MKLVFRKCVMDDLFTFQEISCKTFSKNLREKVWAAF